MPAKKTESKSKEPASVASSKASSAPKTKQSNGNLELTRSIQKISKTQKEFMDAVKTLNSYTEETLNDLNIQIESKKNEIDNLEEEFKISKKKGTIDIDMFFDEYRYDGAVKILKGKGEEPIKSSELHNLKDKIETLGKSRDQEFEEILTKEKSSGESALKAALSNAELKHKAEIADLNATVKQQKNEIATLQSTIANLRDEISAQRELTKEVANASRQGAINQSFGK